MKKQLIPILTLGFLLFCYSTALAQSPDKVLKRAMKAMGGEKALRAVKGTQVSGKITRLTDGTGGTYQTTMSQPNFYMSSYDLNGFETALGYNGKSGWMRDSKTGLRTLTGDIGRDFIAESNYRNNRWLNYKQEKSKIVYGGQSNVNGKTTDVLSLTTSKGSNIKMYFDTTTGLLIKDEIEAGESKNVFEYSDFRAVDGVQEPFAINSTIDGERYEIKLDSIIHNPQVAKTIFDFPNLSNEPLPDIKSLLNELQANEDRVDNILENYTFTQTDTTRGTDKSGALIEKESETFQLSFYKGYRTRRLVAKNSVPLSTEEQAKEDKKVEKRVGEIEKEIAKKEAKAAKNAAEGKEQEEESSRRVSIAELLRASNLINPRRERFRGRDVIVFDFEPNPNFDYKNAKSFLKFFGKTAGVMWIDTQDKQVARLEAVLADNYKVGGGLLANLKKGAAFTLEKERINDEIWLPSLTDINMSIKVLLVKGINVNQITKYSDYQKFNTEIKDSKVDEVKKP